MKKMKKIKFLIIPVVGILLFMASCKKENVTQLPTSDANSTLEQTPVTPQMLSTAPAATTTYKTAALTYTDYKGKHTVKVTNMNGKFLYDIDADGTVDYQIVPKVAGDLSKVQCFNTAGKLLGETSLTVNSSKVASFKSITPDFASSPAIIYNSRDKSLASWKSCVEGFSSSVVGISGAVVAGFGGPWGVAAYYGGIGLGCFFKDVYSNYKVTAGSIKCSNVVTEYSSAVSNNNVTLDNKTAISRIY